MRQGLVTALFLVTALMVTSALSSGVANQLLRYRGEYTYGHEVRSFCPAVNSQCYWVGADTPASVHDTLKSLATISASAPYTPVCVVVEGRIDRDAKRAGFAVDYDGLISITRVFGRCDETDIVTQSDLQHHRWLLQSIDNVPIDAEAADALVPELDFGERMTVTGNTGCNRFSGQAILRENYFLIATVTSTRRLCAPPRNGIEAKVLQVLGSESTIRIGVNRQLILESDHGVLHFRLFDWRR